MPDHPIAWFIFGNLVLAMLALDLGVFHRKPREETLKEALIWSGVWAGLALIFNAGVYYWHGGEKALQFFTGYVVEFSLSVDNLFVFLLVFSYFNVPRLHRRTILFCGILGALIMRALFIATGITLLEKFHWIIYVFGALLVASGIKMARQKDKEVHPERNPVLKMFRRFVPVATDYEGSRFLVRRQGRLSATPLLMVLLVLETTDLVFAVDSVPAVLGITRDPFIVYTSNVFAILGLRSLFFVLEGVINRFRYLHHGLSIVLVFVGLKMLMSRFCPIPTWVSLACILVILTATLIASWLSQMKKSEALSIRTLPRAGLNALVSSQSKGRMRRLSVILFLLLLPAVRVAADDGSDALARGTPANGRSVAFHSAAGHHLDDLAQDFYWSKHALRHLIRRAGTLSGTDDGSLPAADPAVILAGRESTSRLFSVVESPADLLHGWQFNLRTALEPRAPSSLP